MISEPIEPLTRAPKRYTRITGTPDDGYTIEFNDLKESGFKTLAEAKLAADEIERGNRAIQPGAVGAEQEDADLERAIGVARARGVAARQASPDHLRPPEDCRPDIDHITRRNNTRSSLCQSH